MKKEINLVEDIRNIKICPAPVDDTITFSVKGESHLLVHRIHGYDVTRGPRDIVGEKRYTGRERQMLYAQIRKVVPKEGSYFVKIGNRYLCAEYPPVRPIGAHRVMYINGKLHKMVALKDTHTMKITNPTLPSQVIFAEELESIPPGNATILLDRNVIKNETASEARWIRVD